MQRAGWGGTVRGMADEAEAELARLVTYLNDTVVPEVRRGSAAGLRSAAEQLSRLAGQLDREPVKPAAKDAFRGGASSGSGS